MRGRPTTWLLLSMMFFAAAFYFWRLGDRWAAEKHARASHTTPPAQRTGDRPRVSRAVAAEAPFALLSQGGTLNLGPSAEVSTNQPARSTNVLALRLSNTKATLTQLQRSETGLLLENALIDTAQPGGPQIPEHLRSQGDPGSYLVQAKGAVDASFRALLKSAGAGVVSYIPNNAFLVRASGAVARQLAADPRTQSVLPYEPYYKLKPSLLKLAVAQDGLPEHSTVNLLVFADAREQTLGDLANLGAKVLGEDRSPFGPVLQVQPEAQSLVLLARLPGVQVLEMGMPRLPANDLSRVRVGVSTDTLDPTNYLGLTGDKVLVNMNDSGVDATHPDLSSRVFAIDPNAVQDENGHGTHVAGIIASSGLSSTNPVNVGGSASGSVSNASFRGKAPAAGLFVQRVGMLTKPFTDGATLSWPPDGDLQQQAARTNAFISNNSWNYVGFDSQTYDIHAASYDAAVRDALPTVTGSQPLLMVFPAGNSGGGGNNGVATSGDTIETPGTAKNVITVGAIEQLRRITNEVWKCNPPGSTNNCTTNTPWLSLTDSSDQVASFSSRGNVGIGVEGDFGRFKPDLVAPGTFVVSCQSGQWDTNAYYNPTSHIIRIYREVVLSSNELFYDSIFVPANAVQVNITVGPNTNSPIPFPDLPIFVKLTDYATNGPGGYDFVRTNSVSFPPDYTLDPVNTDWFYTVANYATNRVSFDIYTDIVVTNQLGNYLPVLAGMNDALGPYYRYESGTSLAAADASGSLALMQEFFESRLSLSNHSPALFKAMLINGARSVSGNYDFDVRAAVNSQGWGLINLPTSLPGGLTNNTAPTNTVFVFDQDATNALATGQSQTRYITLSPGAQNQVLRVTLVWTDPPGNPIASVKLVNDLNLVVTNLDTSEVFYGNDIQSGSDFNVAWDTNAIPRVDSVNNVENVYLSPSLTLDGRLGTNYSVTVIGHRVNVNAVTANPDNVAQDYALVISSGDSLPGSTLTLKSTSPVVYLTQPLVTVISNSFANSPGYSGGFLMNQRVGANTPLLGTNTILLPTDANGVLTLGMTNQWHFYAITNTTTYTNAAFLTFLPPNLAVPRNGVYEPYAEMATRPEADIDLYLAPPSVANNYGLTNLDPAVVDATDKSLSRGGTETIIYSNATPGIYYIGVKSEDHQAAEYAILGVFSEKPFGGSDTNGNQSLIGFPAPMPIPDGSPERSQAALMVAVSAQPIRLHRVIVTNIINHELITDLVGSLSHSRQFAILNNHTCVTDPATAACETWTSYVYDDSDERNVTASPFLINPAVQRTDGPGSLMNFAGQEGMGQWLMAIVDNATNHVGTNMSLDIFLERQQDLNGNGIIATIEGGACRADYLDVPPEATSMTIDVGIISATPPIQLALQVCPADGGTCKTLAITNTLGGSLTIDQTDLPPLQPGGTYVVRLCNLGSTAVTVNIRASFELSFNTVHPILSAGTTSSVPILDDAITFVYLTNLQHQVLASLDVGLLIDDARVSDLAITLISPNGTRVLLFENRGAWTTNGFGIGTFGLSVVTNVAPFWTNNFNAAPVGLYAAGAQFEGWTVVSNLVDVLDDFTCFCLSNHVLGLLDGAIANSLPTTNALPATGLNSYQLSYRVNHLPWLAGMVTWWPLDVDGTDIFGGLNGLLLGDVTFSTGATNLFFDDFTGPLSANWQASLPNAGTGAGATPLLTYAGAPSYSFGTTGTNSTIRLSNTLNALQRRGWSSTTVYKTDDFRYEVRFNTLNQARNVSTGGFLEMWILDAANTNLYDIVAPYGGTNITAGALLAGSSIDQCYYTVPFSFLTNTWYRLVLSAPRGQGLRASIYNDQGVEMAGATFGHSAAAYKSGFKIVLSQFVTNSATSAPVDVAVDYVRLSSGQSGKVNQALYADGIATRMVVPACPPVDLGKGRGFSIEGWINPFSAINTAPIAEWLDPTLPTNQLPYGLQFWLGLTNGSSSLSAILWDTNSQPHAVFTPPYAITNAGWQHVALTYETNGHNAVLYTNGQRAAAVQFATNFAVRTTGDFYLGYHRANGVIASTYSIPGTANLYSAGRATPVAPGGNGAGTLPIKIQLPVAGNKFQFRALTGVIYPDPTDPCGAEGIPGYTSVISSYLGISGTLVDRAMPLAGVFLTDAAPQDPAPATLDFRPTGITRNFLTLSPAIGQVFYIGNGFTDGGQVQTFIAPAGATRLFVGFPDAIGFQNPPGAYGDNSGSITMEITSGDPSLSFFGGMDEFSLYERALSPCEVNAIYSAGQRGKYGTNVLVCPVATEVTLSNVAGSQSYVFTNGITWTNAGPRWETNVLSFTASTNPTAIVVRGFDPYNPADTNAPNNLNALVDDFVLSTQVTNSVNGLLHFTEDTNLAVLPIKFASSPYVAQTNFPPLLVFSNGFTAAVPGWYTNNLNIAGGPNSPTIGTRDWTVTGGAVTVVSNAIFDSAATNYLAMATGTVQCLLPTIPGHRYQISYTLRGPCAVGWWNGSVDPLSQRAADLINGNNGAFFYGATNVTPGFVGTQGFFFLGQTEPPPEFDPDIFPEDIDDPGSDIELGDPPQLQFTNAFTIEGWIRPVLPTNEQTYCGTEQIFFRGYPEVFDCRGLGDPYWLALEPSIDPTRYDLHFLIANDHSGTNFADVLTTNGPVQLGGGSNAGWWHVAAVFDKPFTNVTTLSNSTALTVSTNALRLYLNGVCVATNYTTLSPYQVLDPGLSPGAAIGGRSRGDWTQPFQGWMDDLTVYSRALTGPELAAIAAAGSAGKAQKGVPPAVSLAKVNVSVDGVSLDTVYADNAQWTTYSVNFTALQTNTVLSLRSLLPGTLFEGVTLSELPPELYYLPEVPLSDLYGEDAYGVWTLELWDNRVGPITNSAQLLQWQINFGSGPSNPPPVITMSHGVGYSNSLPAYGIQYFNVPVPQWARVATNTLLFAFQPHATNALPVSVLFNQTNYPTPADPALIGPLVSSGVAILDTNSTPPLVIGQTYFLAVTNPNPVPVTFKLDVSFDLTTLVNCQVLTNTVGPAGIPRYFQFDVPTNGQPAGALSQAVSLWLFGANSNLTLVMSEHLPLPDLNHYDYISQQPATNNEIVMLVTNTTPFPIQSNRWYVGVYNTAVTNVDFALQACLATEYPRLIPLTNGIPFVAPSPTSQFAAPPGPPRWLFFDFVVTNAVPGVLFELYNLSGDADLVLQRMVPPTMAPYFEGSFAPDTTPEQIVLRTNADVPDLRGHWYLGVYNNEATNVAFTIRATLPNTNGLLLSAQPLTKVLTPLNPPHGLLLSWNSVAGEHYIVQYTTSIATPVIWTNIGYVTATTPLSTFEVLPVPAVDAFYRIVQVYSGQPRLFIQFAPPSQVRLSWSTAYPGYNLQSKVGLNGAWANAGLTINVVGTEYVAFDTIGPVQKYYRLYK